MSPTNHCLRWIHAAAHIHVINTNRDELCLPIFEIAFKLPRINLLIYSWSPTALHPYRYSCEGLGKERLASAYYPLIP